MATYRYFGPIIRYNIVQVHNWKAETKAVSLAKAISNIKYKAKEYLGLAPSAKIEILNYKVEEVEDLDMNDLEEIKKSSREYDPNYDIPDEAEEIYGSNIFAKDNFCTLNPGIVKLKRASKKFNQRDRKFRNERICDVKPKKNEIKPEFIARFMRETKNEYPDFKQRLAVAYDYWERYKRVKDGRFCDSYRIKDWMPSKTPLDYITEELEDAGIEYELRDDMYGFNAPFDTIITVLDTNDGDRADEIICSIVGYAYEIVRDHNGNKRDFKIVTDEELIDEFNQ